MTEEPPPLPAIFQTSEQDTSWWARQMRERVEIRTKFTKEDIQDLPAFARKLQEKPDPVSAFLSTALSEETHVLLADYQLSPTLADAHSLQLALAQDLDQLVRQDPSKLKPEQIFYDSQRFQGIKLSAKTQELLAADAQNKNSARLNRLLLADAFPGVLAYQDGVWGISDAGAATLASFGFLCFFVGRITGAGLLKKFSAHRALGFYALMNVIACFLVFCKLGWISVACVFVSYFFMSIMFPTIFALGIFGLGARAKNASSFIVMAIMGGAVLPKLMGAVADHYDMSRGFVVPMACFVFIALYGFCWPMLSNAKSLHGENAA